MQLSIKGVIPVIDEESKFVSFEISSLISSKF